MEWANENGLDTAKLKAAKIPIYGKWYFPDLPADVLMINLKSGEIQSFGPGLRAGEILYVTRFDLRRARLGPYAALPEPEAARPASGAAAPIAAAAASELAAAAAARSDEPRAVEPSEPLNFHLPGPSIFPLVLALGLSIMLVGLVVGPVELRIIVALLGLVYLVAGAVGWTVQNRNEGLAAEAGGGPGDAAGAH
jgi:hypothetical protein